MWLNLNGDWKKGRPWVNVNGNWTKSIAVWQNVNGIWHKMSFGFYGETKGAYFGIAERDSTTFYGLVYKDNISHMTPNSDFTTILFVGAFTPKSHVSISITLELKTVENANLLLKDLNAVENTYVLKLSRPDNTRLYEIPLHFSDGSWERTKGNPLSLEYSTAPSPSDSGYSRLLSIYTYILATYNIYADTIIKVEKV